MRRLLLTIEKGHSQPVASAVISLDAEKAFDRVEWNFLFACLGKMNFGHDFQRWVKLLYNNTSASVLTNGLISDPFELHRGTRQGCPLSPLLFILSMEPLAVSLRAEFGKVESFEIVDLGQNQLFENEPGTSDKLFVKHAPN
ncbi:uncharacterized protein [Ambystoma mexicanum]|uniref:uncharacterized protein n=1 Tax=Ambystoma mexicanum TaxID=8296 RepID=UPI0037E92652